MRTTLLVIATLILSAGCATDDLSPCEAANDYLIDCLGDQAPADFPETCDQLTAETVMSMSCDQIAADEKVGKADLWGKEQGDSCIFNFQCSDPFVCRPVAPESGTLGTADEFCKQPGSFGELCDSGADCADDLACVGDDWFGDNGRCRKPISN